MHNTKNIKNKNVYYQQIALVDRPKTALHFSAIICNHLQETSTYIRDIIYLVNETKLVHNLFLVYFVNFMNNLYTFRTSPVPSSGGTTVFTRHCMSECLVCRFLHTRQSAIYFHINTVVLPDDGS